MKYTQKQFAEISNALEMVALEFGISVEDLRSPKRETYHVLARRRFANILHNAGFSRTMIGRALNRDRTSTYYYFR